MAIGEIIYFNDMWNTPCELEIGRTLYNDGTENFLTNPQFSSNYGYITGTNINPQSWNISYFNAYRTPFCAILNKIEGQIELINCNINEVVIDTVTEQIIIQRYNISDLGPTNFANINAKKYYWNSNIPIFSNDTEAVAYYEQPNEHLRLEALKLALNYYGGAINDKDTEDYYIYNTFDTADIELGIVTYTGGNPTGRFEIFKANREPALYMKNIETSCEMGLLYSEIVGSCFSSINKYDVIQKQFDPNSWEEKTLIYSGPFYNVLDYLPDGSYTIGVTLDTNIPIFKNQADADAYLRGELSIEEAINYGGIGKPNIATNESGAKELVTEFGSNESETVFSHDYLMSLSELQSVGGEFFDTNILQNLLDGLKLYGNDPMQSVLSCLYFPFDLTTICTDAVSVSDIYFGSYKMENKSARKVKHRSGYKELGQTFIKPTFYNFLDYVAMHIYLYLPYIGFVELDVNKYLNKWLKIIYMVDIHTGECEVSLTANGLLMDTYSGQIGIKNCLTWQDQSAYFQSQITALRNGVMSAVGLPIGGTLTGAQAGGMGGPYGAIAGAAVGGTVGEIAGKASIMWTGYKFGNTKPPLFSKGGYSSEIGANMPQYAFLVFMYNDVEIPTNLADLYGRPSNKSGNVGSFSGFLSTNCVQLQVPTATSTEKAEISALLNDGIYI